MTDKPTERSPDTAETADTTHFGYESVATADKSRRVDGVFSSVAERYDLMNDLMSGGLHRLWKQFTLGRAALRPGMKVLDVAGGTADMSRAFARKVGPQGQVWLTDINAPMLRIGRDRMLDDGCLQPAVQCDAQQLPFPGRGFDRVCVAFGLRNVTDKAAALREMHRVLKPGGKLLVLEFSRVTPALARAYDAYSFGLLPRIGRLVTGDADSYRYLAESIRIHPDQETLAQMMRDAGFDRVSYTNLTAGIVALHEGTVL